MKKNFFFYIVAILVLLVAIPAYGQQSVPQEMWIYRNDGNTQGFRCGLIDSIRYSKLSLDSIASDDYVVQEVWSQNSVCRIPLTAIDSVAFTTPKPIYKQGVKIHGDELTEYIIGIDSLTILLSTDCPQALMPATGDTIALTPIREDLPCAFCGIVEEVSATGDDTMIKCRNIAPTEVFERLYMTFSSDIVAPDVTAYAASSPRRGLIEKPVNKPVSIYLPIHLGAKSNILPEWLSWGLKIDDDGPSIALENSTSLDGSYSLTNGHMAGYLAIDNILPVFGPVWDCSLTITGESTLDLTLTHIYDASASIDIDLITKEKIPLVPEIGLFLDIKGGMAINGEGKLVLENGLKVTDEKFMITFSASNNPLQRHNIPSSVHFKPKVTIQPSTLAGEVTYRLGPFIEFDFNIVDSELDKVGVRVETGAELEVKAGMAKEDFEHMLDKTDAYITISEKSGWKVRPYFALSAVGGIGAFEGSIPWEVPEKWLPSYQSGIMPVFSNIEWTDEDILKADISGNVFPPIPVGFLVTDVNNTEVFKVFFKTAYLRFDDKASITDYSLPLNGALNKTKNYTIYPIVKLFGIDNLTMLAEPSVELTAIKPLTGDYGNVTSSSATLNGHLEGRTELLDRDCRYGFAYSIDANNGHLAYATLKEDGNMVADIDGLIGGKTYRYRAFFADGNEYVYGEEKEFTTILPVEIKTITTAAAQYRPTDHPQHFIYKEKPYEFKYNVATTVTLTNDKGVENWGYVYEGPYEGDKKSRISLEGAPHTYEDTRFAYYRNGRPTKHTVRLYPFVKYTGDDEYYYGEPVDYPLTYPETSTVELTGCSTNDVVTRENVEYNGVKYDYCSTFILDYNATGAYWITVGAEEIGNGWSGWDNSLPARERARATDGSNRLTINYYYNQKVLEGDYKLRIKGTDEQHGTSCTSPQSVKLTHNGKTFTGCEIIQ